MTDRAPMRILTRALALVAAASVVLVLLPPVSGALLVQTPIQDLGRIRQSNPDLPPLHRDAGMNVRLADGRTLWLFGDTLNGPGGVKSSSAAVGNRGSTVVDDLVDASGAPVQVVPYTFTERVFNANPTNVAVGRRLAIWPAGVVTNDGTNLLVFYGQVTVHNDWAQWVAGPTGVGTAVYQPGGALVVTRVEDELFTAAEGFRGGFVAARDGYVYGYDCSMYVGCKVGRAATADVADRSAWRFWNGTVWVADIAGAAYMTMPDPEAQIARTIGRYPNSGNVSIGYSPALGQYVMSYVGWPGLGDTASVRTAPNPWGPWTPPAQHRLPGCASFNCYWAIYHEGFSTSSRIGLSYFRPDEPNPVGFNGAVRVLQLSTEHAFVNPFGNVDSASAVGPSGARVKGWVVDPDTTAPVDVHVYVDGKWGGAYTASTPRPDVGAVLEGYGSAHGFDISLSGLAPGSRRVCVYGINAGPGGNSLVACRQVLVRSGSPFGSVDSSAQAGPGRARVQGWALDPDTTAPVDVHVYVDGKWGGAYTANVSRPDVGAAYPGYGSAHGYDISLSGLASGSRRVCVYGIDVGPGENSLISCRQVAVRGGSPFGNVDSLGGAGPGRAIVQGWALDPDTTAPVDVHVYVDGKWGGAYTANVSRPDVGVAYPGYGSAHGYDVSLSGLASGSRRVCVYAINIGPGSNSLVGCRTIVR